MKSAYDDIIHLPHHVSKTHPQMSLENRAAQFSPFAALSGHGDAVAETARLTDQRIELSEDVAADLDRKLNALKERIGTNPVVTITHFRLDAKKAGGEYVSITGAIKRIDAFEHCIVLANGERIEIGNILDLSFLMGGCE